MSKQPRILTAMEELIEQVQAAQYSIECSLEEADKILKREQKRWKKRKTR